MIRINPTSGATALALFAVLGGCNLGKCPSSDDLQGNFGPPYSVLPAAGDVVEPGDVEFHFLYELDGLFIVEDSTDVSSPVEVSVDGDSSHVLWLDEGEYAWRIEGHLSTVHEAYGGCILGPIEFGVAEATD